MFRLLVRTIGILILLAILAAPQAAAGDPVQVRITGVDASDFPNVRATVGMTDAAGQPVDGVTATDVIVSEDGRPQRASLAPIGEQRPIALVLALDVSGSMAGKPLADAKAAMTQLVGSLRGVDSAAVITFNTRVSLAQPLTTDKSALTAAIGAANANGNTAIFDALDTAIETLTPVDPRARRAVVLLTDGADNSSARSLASVVDRLRAQKYPLYVVGLGTNLDEGVLRALADAGTGGALTIAPSSTQLAAIYAGLAQEIRVQYDVSYRSDTSRAAEGSQVTLTLQVVRAGTVVGTGRVTFVVPVGHGVLPPVASADARVPSTAQAPTGGGSVDPSVIGLLGGLSTLALLLWVSTILESQALFRLASERLERYSGLDDRAASPRRSFYARAVRPTLLRLAEPFGRFAPRRMVDSTRLKLVRSGGLFDLGAVEFIGLRVGLAFVLGIVGTLIAMLLRSEMTLVALAALVGMMFGYLIPGVWLDRVVKARQYRILRALPSALDMLALSAGAGMTLDGAVGQVAQRWKGPLSDEFRQLLIEFNMGRDRRAALRALGERTGVPEVARFANAIVQADALGTPISRVLSEQAVEMRTRRRQRAEESARKAPVKMLFPMVGLIFPALFVVILGPAVPRFMDLFTQVH